jgi:hypothetical protein
MLGGLKLEPVDTNKYKYQTKQKRKENIEDQSQPSN